MQHNFIFLLCTTMCTNAFLSGTLLHNSIDSYRLQCKSVCYSHMCIFYSSCTVYFPIRIFKPEINILFLIFYFSSKIPNLKFLWGSFLYIALHCIMLVLCTPAAFAVASQPFQVQLHCPLVCLSSHQTRGINTVLLFNTLSFLNDTSRN